MGSEGIGSGASLADVEAAGGAALLQGAANIAGSAPAGSPPSGAGAAVAELFKQYLIRSLAAGASSVSHPEPSAPPMHDPSRPVGSVKRTALTPAERQSLETSAPERRRVVTDRLGLPADARIVLEMPVMSGAIWDVVLWSASWEVVSFGQAVPIHAIAPASTPPTPAPAADRESAQSLGIS